ncbi:MAG: hypothetical protein RID22_05840 [Roseibium aggregatum]
MTYPPFDLYSEPYSSTGNIGENFRRLLGSPSLDPLQTLVREAVQNIADAAKLGSGPEILIRLRTLSPMQRATLEQIVLRHLPEEPASRGQLRDSLARQDLHVLEICDFQTTGLGGPTRSDRIPVGTKDTDFIDFLRNIGSARDTEHGGGTYGFGKVALYRESRCSTILVDTLSFGAAPEDRRLIGCHVGRSFGLPEEGMLRRFTGRHWWGKADQDDGVADPVAGRTAAAISASLGFPPRDDANTGTSIMILDFEAEDENLVLAGQRVVEALLWNFWPRMMREIPDERRFVCRVEVEGNEVHIPAPEEFPPLHLFCKAMQAARKQDGNDVRTIETQRPPRTLGTLALEKGLRSPRVPLVDEGSQIPATSNHIALMRPVELVVKYLDGSALPDERLEWAGVFLASSSDEVEQAFADSEPPAHDDWIPDNLPKGNGKTFVNVAMKKLRSAAAEMGVSGVAVTGEQQSGPPLARLAGRLGAMLEEVGGDGAGRRRPSRGGGNRKPTRAKASRPVFVCLEPSDHGRIAVFTTEVTQDGGRNGATLSASVSIAIDGTGAGRMDDNILQPTVLSISPAEEGKASDGATRPLEGKEGRFELRVLVPDDYAVTVDAEVLQEMVE